MTPEIKAIWEKGLELGFQLNESDAHDIWIAVKECKNRAKRFRLIDDEKQIESFDSTEEVYDYLHDLTITRLQRIDHLSVHCTVDDIKISAKELFISFEEDECPGDLQFF